MRKKGLTLVELMVVMGIIMTLASIALVSQNSFNKSLLVANTAYDIALTLRGAERYGLSTRAEGAISNAGYGLHFARSSPTTFTLFADLYPLASISSDCHPTSDASTPSAKPGNCVFDESQGEKIITYTLGNGITVSDFCGYAAGVWTCANSNGASLTSLDIVFARPNPDAFMSTNGSYDTAAPVTAACLVVTSPSGGYRYVKVSSTGAISANASSCP